MSVARHDIVERQQSMRRGCAQVLGGVAALLVGALVVEPAAADLARLVGAGKRHCPNTRSLSIYLI